MFPASPQSGRLRTVTSAQNSLVKDFRKAFAAGALVDGAFAIEGMKLIEEAIRSGLKIRAVVFSESGAARAERLLPQLSAQAETIVVDDQIFSAFAQTETPQGVAALVAVKEFELGPLLSVAEPLLVVVVGLQDPGNLGTILRCAEAFGATAVILAEKTVSRFNHKVIRASAGSAFRLPCIAVPTDTLIPKLREKQIRMLATSSHKGGDPIDMAALIGKVAIFIGNEGAGLPKEVMAQMDGLVTIPQSEKVESLNAGIATSIILYEAARQRRG
ncbi:MAG TPA: RNA methyltransferase [Terriglobales bacterium]|nr:RNA methyltransferase [Terriglobales bacterium]